MVGSLTDRQIDNGDQLPIYNSESNNLKALSVNSFVRREDQDQDQEIQLDHIVIEQNNGDGPKQKTLQDQEDPEFPLNIRKFMC